MTDVAVFVSTMAESTVAVAAAGAVAGALVLSVIQGIRRKTREARESARERDAAYSRAVTAVRLHGDWRRPIYLAPPRTFIDRVEAN
jgi:hypothetical protein